MIGTSFPASIGTGTTGTTFPASIGTTGTTGTTFPPSIGNRAGPRSQVDDRHQLPAVDRHDGHHGHRCEPWPWMIGTTFPPSIGTGTTGTSFPVVEARHHLPGVDHRQQDRGRCEPWPWMIGTTFPAVDRHGRHDGHQLPAVNHRQQGRTAQLGR